MLANSLLLDTSNAELDGYFTYVGDACPSALKCAICKDPYVNPVELEGCRHTYCRRCLQRCQESATGNDDERVGLEPTVTCPMCKGVTRVSADGRGAIHPIVQNQLDELFVKCTECQLRMQRQFFPKHYEKDCEYRIVQCPNLHCQENVVRRELAVHSKNCIKVLHSSRLHSEQSSIRALSPSAKSAMSSSRCFPANDYGGFQASNATEVNNKDGTGTASFCSGVVFEYFQGEFDKLPNFDNLQEPTYAGVVGGFSINEGSEIAVFDKAGGSEERTILDTGNFAVRFNSFLDINQEGLYTFYLSSNDGSALHIGGKKVVDNDGQHYSKEVDGQIMLDKGRYPISVHFFHRNGKILEGFRAGPSLSLQYYCPGPYWPMAVNSIPKQAIPEQVLQYDFQDTTIRKLLLNALSLRSAKKNNADNYADGNAVSTSANPRDLQLQLDVAQATIKSLQNSLYEFSISSDLKLQAMRREVEEERVKFREMAEAVRNVFGLENVKDGKVMGIVNPIAQHEIPFSSIGTSGEERIAGAAAACQRMDLYPSAKYGENKPMLRVAVDSDQMPSVPQLSVSNNEGAVEVNGINFDERGQNVAADSGRTLQNHLEQVEKLKQMYFISMALSVKMNIHMQGRGNGRNTPVIQEMYELCKLENIPLGQWPAFIANQFSP